MKKEKYGININNTFKMIKILNKKFYCDCYISQIKLFRYTLIQNIILFIYIH